MGDNITSVADECFAGITSLAAVDFGNSAVTSVGDSAFMGCSGLSSANMPFVDTLGSNVFYNCRALADVSMPSISVLYDRPFYNCDSLTDESVRSLSGAVQIGTWVFGSDGHNQSITQIDLRNVTGKTHSGMIASLKKLVYANTPNIDDIYNMTFAGCPSLSAIDFRTRRNDTVVGIRSLKDGSITGCYEPISCYVRPGLAYKWLEHDNWKQYIEAGKVEICEAEAGTPIVLGGKEYGKD